MRSLLAIGRVNCRLSNFAVRLERRTAKLVAARGRGFYGGLILAVLSGLLLAPATHGQTEIVLHSFDGQGGDGSRPFLVTLVLDKSGHLFGTTSLGGTHYLGRGGTVFEVTPSGTETVLHSFDTSGDGCYPFATLILDSDGNLYGTTQQGGAYGNCYPSFKGCGTVFELTPSGNEIVLWSFGNGEDGKLPYCGLVFDTAGNLYGTTYEGGTYGGS